MKPTIKYLLNGEYQYATVKDIGDIEKLRTIIKTDLVGAINSLLGVIPDDLLGRLSQFEQDMINLENSGFNVIQAGELQNTIAIAQAEINAQLQLQIDALEGVYDQKLVQVTSDYDIKVVEVKSDIADVKTNILATETSLLEVNSKLTNVEIGVTEVNQTVDLVKGDLATKVNSTNFDILEATVGVNETAIEQNKKEIALKASQENLDLTTGRVVDAEAKIELNAQGITSTVKRDELRKELDEVSIYGKNLLRDTRDWKSWEANNTANAYEISETYNHLHIQEQKGSGSFLVTIVDDLIIGKTYNASIWAKSNSAGAKLALRVDSIQFPMTNKNDDIFLSTSWQRVKVNFVATSKESFIAFSTSNVASGVVTQLAGAKIETGTENTGWQAHENDVYGRIVSAESVINQQADQITSIVTEQVKIGEDITSQTTEINQLSGKIALQVTKLEEIDGALSQQKSSIELNAGNILSKVEQSDIDQTIDGISLDNRNMIQNSDFILGLDKWSNVDESFKLTDINDKKYLSITRSGLSNNLVASSSSNMFSAKVGDKLSVGLDIIVSSLAQYDVKTIAVLDLFDINDTRVSFKEFSLTDFEGNLTDGINSRIVTRYAVDRADVSKGRLRLTLYRNGSIFYTNITIVKGDIKSVGWIPAPEDSQQVQANMKTMIDQNAQSISLKAESDTVDKITGRLETNESELLIANDKITANIEKLTNVDGVLSQHTAEITATAEALSSKMTAVQVDELVEGKSYASQSELTQTAQGFTTTVSTISTKVGELETEVKDTKYTWIMWADDIEGNGISASNVGKKFMGIAYNKPTINGSLIKSDYTWSKAVGEDGISGVSVGNIVSEYRVTTSDTIVPTTGWTTTVPSRTAGQFLWVRERITYTNNSIENVGIRVVTGDKGDTGIGGVSITGVVAEFAVNTSKTTAPTTGYITTQPARSNGQFLWRRDLITYSDSSTSLTTAVIVTGDKGDAGLDAQLLYLSSDIETMTFTATNVADPLSQVAKITAKLQNIDGTAVFTAKAFNGTTVLADTITLSGTGFFRTLNVSTFPANATHIEVTASIGSLTDTVSIFKLKHGEKGTGGDAGQNAIVGFLTNESITLGASSAGVVASFATATGSFRMFEGLVNTSSLATYNVASSSGVTVTINTSGVYTVSAMTTDNATADLRATYKGVEIIKTLTLAKSKTGIAGAKGDNGDKGADAYTVILSNESHAFSGDETKAIASSTIVNVIAYKGATKIASTIGTITGQLAGLTTTISGNGTLSNSFTATASTALIARNGVLTIPITVDGVSFTKTFSFTLALKGVTGNDGVNAQLINLTASSQIFTNPKIGAVTPTTITVNGTAQNTTIATWQYSTNGGSFTTTLPVGVTRSGNVVTLTGTTMTAKTIAVKALNGLIEDVMTIAKVEDGIDGGTGIGVTSVDVEYYLSTSSTLVQGGTGWFTTAPAWIDGRFMWSRTITTFTSGDPKESNPVCITGGKGATGTGGSTGRGVNAITEEYALSTSKVTAPTVFVATAPTWSTGNYMWTRSKIVYSLAPLIEYTTPYVDTSWEAVNLLKTDVDTSLGAMNTSVTTLQNTTIPALEDNLLNKAEKEAVRQSLNIVKTDKGVVDTQYTVVYSNSALIGTPKTNLYNAKIAFNTAYTNLEAGINVVLNVADGTRITPAQFTNVQTRFTQYTSALTTLRQRFEESMDSISGKKVDDIEIGGRNLIPSIEVGDYTATSNGITVQKRGTVYRIFGTNTKTDVAYGLSGGGWLRSGQLLLEPSGTYTLSTTTPLPTGLYLGWNGRNSSGVSVALGYLTGDGVRKSVTHTVHSTHQPEANGFFGIHSTTGTIDVTFQIKLERGNKATTHTDSPEDEEFLRDTKTHPPVRYIRDWANGSSANTSNHWVEIEAYSKGTNVALGKTVTTNSTTTTSIARVTDGILASATHYASGTGALHFVQVDLGQVYYNVDSVKVWHFYGDPRTYRDTKTEVSPDGITWYTIFDSYNEGEYVETINGRTSSNTFAKHEALTSTASRIRQLASEIDISVKSGDLINSINVSEEGITIQANKINFVGAVNFSSFSTIMQTDYNTVKTTANTAEATATTALTNAGTANASITDMMSDLKITPIEKSELSRLWERIKAEYTQLSAQATALSVVSTNYVNAYNALNTTTPRIQTDILASMTATYTLTTATRDTFKTQMNTYFAQSEAISKAIGDKIQSNANTALTNASTAQTTANTANSTANTALTNAGTANASVADMMNDLKVTPIEKSELSRLWERIKAEYAQLSVQATALGVTSTTYVSAYTALDTTAPRIQLDILASMTTTYTLTTITRDAFKAQINTYFTQAETLGKAIRDKIQANAGTAQTTANTANTNASTAQTTANTASTNANTALTNASTAQTTANTALTNASTANTAVADIMSDLKITPVEKSELGRLWERIKAEYLQLSVQATALSVVSTTYVNAYNALDTTAPRIQTDVLASMTTTYTLTTATRDTFKTQMNTYFTQAETLGKAIRDKIQANASTAQTTANTAVTNASTAQTRAVTAEENAIKYTNENTGNLLNNPAVSGNATRWSGTGLTAVDKIFDGITTKVIQSSTASDIQNYSEYFKVDPSKAYEVSMWISKSVANASGYYIGLNGINSAGSTVGFTRTNSTGTIGSALDTNFYFISGTPPIDWVKFVGYIMPVGTLSTSMVGIGSSSNAIMKQNIDRVRVRVLNWSNLATATTNQLWIANPKVVEVDPNTVSASALAQVTANTAQTTANTANTNAGTANTAIGDIMSDLKITPVEKSELSRLWERIKAEYLQLSVQATAVGVTSTNYVNAYNALNTTAPRIQTDILASMTTVYTLTTATRDTFKTQLNTYFTQAETISKAIGDKIQANATNAQSRVLTVEGKIDNAVTTIDGTGVTVKDGSFFLKDDYTNDKYSIVAKENLIRDHSFELIDFQPDAINPSNFKIDGLGNNYVQISPDGFSRWATIGNPRVFSALNNGMFQSSGMFGMNAVHVSRGNEVYQEIALPDKSKWNKDYTASVFCRRSIIQTTGDSLPGIALSLILSDGTEHKTLTRGQLFKQGDSHTFRMVQTRNLSELVVGFTDAQLVDASIRLTLTTGSTTSWAYMDGVQLVEGSHATHYSPEDMLFHMMNGVKGAESKAIISRNLTVSDNAYFANGFLSQGNARIWADLEVLGKTSTNSIDIKTGNLNHTSTGSRDKLRVWNSANYTIGMDTGFTFGYLTNDYAMTFQMNNAVGRGFWWGDTGDSNADGAMSLTTDGRLYVKGETSLASGTVVANSTDLKVNSRGNVLRFMSPDANGHAYMSWYGGDNVRRGYFGFANTTSNQIELRNETLEDIRFTGGSLTFNVDRINGDFTFKKNTGKTITTINATNGSSNSYNTQANANLYLENNNNSFSILLGGTENNRNSIIQGGHSSSTYATSYSHLYINKFGGTTYIGAGLTVTGTKNAVHVTRDGFRATPAYEMAESYLGDMGSDYTDGERKVVIDIDSIFLDVINTDDYEYYVFLQSHSESKVWVSERKPTYFIVESSMPNADFSWELKAKRKGYEKDRLVLDKNLTLEDIKVMSELNGQKNEE